MSVKEIMAKTRQAFEEYNKGNVNAHTEFLREVFAPDAVFHRPPWTDAKGLETWIKGVSEGFQGFSDIKFDWEDMIGVGDTIAYRYTMRMKHTGKSPMFPGPPTGKELVLNGAWFYKVKNNKIVEQFNFTDWLGAYQQLGITPPMVQRKNI